MTSRKSLPPDASALLDLVTDAPRGTVVGRFSVFNEIDGMGDRTKAGCFDAAISHLKRNGVRLPLLYHHQTTKSESIIGVVDELWCDKSGAWFKARLDMSNPTAQRLYAVMSLNPTALGVSYGYGVPKGGSRLAKDGATDIVKVFPLLEISLTPTPALDVARVEAVKNSGRALTKAENLLLSLEATAARGGFKSHDAVYVWDGLVNDPVFAFDHLEASMSAKSGNGNGNCADCGQFITKSPTTVPRGYGYLHVRCEKCGSINLLWDETKSLTKSQFDSEVKRLTMLYKDRERNTKVITDLEKAQQKREVQELLKFSGAPARPSRTDVKAEIDSFMDVLKPSPKSTTDIASLFGDAPPIPKEKLQ